MRTSSLRLFSSQSPEHVCNVHADWQHELRGYIFWFVQWCGMITWTWNIKKFSFWKLSPKDLKHLWGRIYIESILLRTLKVSRHLFKAVTSITYVIRYKFRRLLQLHLLPIYHVQHVVNKYSQQFYPPQTGLREESAF